MDDAGNYIESFDKKKKKYEKLAVGSCFRCWFTRYLLAWLNGFVDFSVNSQGLLAFALNVTGIDETETLGGK